MKYVVYYYYSFVFQLNNSNTIHAVCYLICYLFSMRFRLWVVNWHTLSHAPVLFCNWPYGCCAKHHSKELNWTELLYLDFVYNLITCRQSVTFAWYSHKISHRCHIRNCWLTNHISRGMFRYVYYQALCQCPKHRISYCHQTASYRWLWNERHMY
jgi:hypothetical protein